MSLFLSTVRFSDSFNRSIEYHFVVFIQSFIEVNAEFVITYWFFFFRTHWTLNIQKYKSCLSFCFCFIFYLFIYFFSIFGLFCPHWRITWDDDMKSVLCLGLAVFLGSVENLLKCFLSKNGFIWVIPSNRLGKKFWVWLRLQIEVCVCSDFARFIDFFSLLFSC